MLPKLTKELRLCIQWRIQALSLKGEWGGWFRFACPAGFSFFLFLFHPNCGPSLRSTTLAYPTQIPEIWKLSVLSFRINNKHSTTEERKVVTPLKL